MLDRGAQVVAHGVSQLLGRGIQAVARGAARCESQVLDRGAQAVARGAVCCASRILDGGAQAVGRGAGGVTTCVGATAKLRPPTRTFQKYIAAKANLPLYK
jgi:hypothetical protein